MRKWWWLVIVMGLAGAACAAAGTNAVGLVPFEAVTVLMLLSAALGLLAAATAGVLLGLTIIAAVRAWLKGGE